MTDHNHAAPPMSDHTASAVFIDRRQYVAANVPPVIERRQFTNSHQELPPKAREIATAVDQYKLQHRRRFINYEELLGVIESLGYRKP